MYFAFFDDNLSRVERTVFFFAKETAKEKVENYAWSSRVTAGLTKYDAFAAGAST